MDFRIDEGPWETIFSGKFMKHETEIVVNPEKFFLIIIYENDPIDKNKVGAVFQGYKAMVARGNLDSFITTIPKPAIGITKSNGEQTKKMIFVSFNPIYVNFKQDDFIRKVDNAIKKSYNEINEIIELAKSSGIKMQDTSMASEADYAPILSDPMVARLLMSGLRQSSLEMINIPTFKQSKEEKEVQLGLNKKREIIKEDVKTFYRTIILGENKVSVNYSSYILNENFLLENISTIIFDEDDYFSTIGNASKNEIELKENLVEYDPTGFPMKKINAKKDIKVSFKNCNIELIFNLFNIGDDKLLEALTTNKFNENTPKEIIENLQQIDYLNDFQKLKLERLLNIFDKEFENFFGEQFDVNEITKKWSQKLGKTTIININDLSTAEKIIFLDYVINSLKEKNEKEEDIIIIMPNINELIQTEKERFLNQISFLENKGFGFVLGTKKSSPELKELISTQINIVNKKDVAIMTKSNRTFRVNLRPNLSGDIKFN